MNKQLVLDKFKSLKFKVTPARMAVVEGVIKYGQKPFSAEQLFKKSKCDLASVYRTLNILEKIKVIRKSDFLDNKNYFELVANQAAHKHQIICKVCQKVDVLDFCLIDAQKKKLSTLGYTKISHRLELTGVCADCDHVSV